MCFGLGAAGSELCHRIIGVEPKNSELDGFVASPCLVPLDGADTLLRFTGFVNSGLTCGVHVGLSCTL